MTTSITIAAISGLIGLGVILSKPTETPQTSKGLTIYENDLTNTNFHKFTTHYDHVVGEICITPQVIRFTSNDKVMELTNNVQIVIDQ
jgi:hypothetical protein